MHREYKKDELFSDMNLNSNFYVHLLCATAILKVQDAKASASKSVELAICKRKRAQLLTENADLAMYRAIMALRIADASEILDSEQAANHFLDEN